MRDYFFSAELLDGCQICIAPISLENYEANEGYDLGDDHGFFIYEYDSSHPSAGIEVLAKVASFDAAMRLVDIYFSAINQKQDYADSATQASGD